MDSMHMAAQVGEGGSPLLFPRASATNAAAPPPSHPLPPPATRPPILGPPDPPFGLQIASATTLSLASNAAAAHAVEGVLAPGPGGGAGGGGAGAER